MDGPATSPLPDPFDMADDVVPLATIHAKA